MQGHRRHHTSDRRPPLLRRWWFTSLLVVGSIVVLGLAISLSGPSRIRVPASPAPVAPAAAPDAPTTTNALDNEWRLVDYRIADDGTGFFTGAITVVNEAAAPRSGLFALALSKAGGQPAVLHARTSTVQPGGRVTLDLYAGGLFVPGPYTVGFLARSS